MLDVSSGWTFWIYSERPFKFPVSSLASTVSESFCWSNCFSEFCTASIYNCVCLSFALFFWSVDALELNSYSSILSVCLFAITSYSNTCFCSISNTNSVFKSEICLIWSILINSVFYRIFWSDCSSLVATWMSLSNCFFLAFIFLIFLEICSVYFSTFVVDSFTS